MAATVTTLDGKALEEARPTTNSQFQAWVEGWHRRLRREAFIIESAAEHIRSRLSRAKGMERITAAIKARKVASRFKRAALLTDAAAAEFAKGMGAYIREYGGQLPGAQSKNGQAPFRFDR